MELNGPLFDGQAAIAVRDYCEDVELQVADEGVGMVKSRLNQVLRTQTPYYATKIEQMPFQGHRKVTGESVIYHWWLEGKGSRNYPVTRFKGYHTFEITAGTLRSAAGALAESVLRPFLRRMGGGA